MRFDIPYISTSSPAIAGASPCKGEAFLLFYQPYFNAEHYSLAT